MPQYNVIKKAFYDGKLYDPVGKRRVLTVDKPFTEKEIPSWVEAIKAAPKAKQRFKAKAAPKTEPSFLDDTASKSVETL